MKKFYSILLAVLCVAGIAIAGRSVADITTPKAESPSVVEAQTLAVGNKNIATHKQLALGELQQFKKGDLVSAAAPAKPAEFKSVTPRKAPAKAVAKETIEGDWDCEYTGMLSNNSGLHSGTATFTWVDLYDQFEVVLPDNNSGADLYADYDEATGKLTFNLEILGQTSSGYVAQWPMIGTSVQEEVTATYDEATKSIVFDNPNAALAIAALSSTSTSSLLGYYWAGNAITLERPDGDYALKVAFAKECTADNNFQYTITKGEDITTIYTYMSPGDLSAADYFEGYESLITMLGDQTAAGTYSLSPEAEMEESGYYTVMAYGYNAANQLVKKAQDVVFVTLNEDDAYTTIGTIPYDDKLVNGYYNGFTNTKDAVEIQEKTNTPGVYRLVNAYAGQSAIHDAGHNHYIYIDAQDPEFVNINTSNTGLDFGDGMLVFGTMGGALGYSKADCTKYGYEVGALDGRTITFGTRTVLAHEKKYNSPGSWSYMNPNNVMTIELPKLTLKVTVKNKTSNAAVENVAVEVEGVTATTDADGVATLELPATVDYLAEVSLKASLADATETHSVKLTGADNDVEILSDLAPAIESVGTYDMTVQATDINGKRGEASEIKVEVTSDGTNYYLQEVEGTNLFNGVTIPFTMSGENNAVFKSFYAGQIEGKHIWVASFVYSGTITEPQEQYTIPFNAETGFDPADNCGFGWFITADEEYAPEDLYSGFYLKASDPDEGDDPEEGEKGNYPAFETLVGDHEFTSTLTFEPGYEAFKSEFFENGTLKIDSDMSLVNFLKNNFSPYFTYNQDAGTITLRNNNVGFVMNYDDYTSINVGLADAEGNWNGVQTNNTDVVWKVTEDGHIIIPDFTLVAYTYGSTVAPIVARYTNVKVDGYPEDETPEEPEIVSGSATYAVQTNETHTAGDVVDVKDGDEVVATLQFGFEGGADFSGGKANSALKDKGFVAYTEGNGENGKPTSGTTYIIKPKYNGKVGVGYVLNADKKFFVLEDGVALPEYDGMTVSSKVTGGYSEFDVTGGKTYTVYCDGSKLGFYGFNYDYEDVIGGEEPEPDPDQPTEGDITGNMTSQLDQNMGMGEEPNLNDPEDFVVTASYDADTQKLTIFNFAELNPITFTIDTTTGKAVAENQVAYVDDYYEDDVYTYYYGNFNEKSLSVTANAYTEDGKTVLYVDPWGETWGEDSPVPGYEWFFNTLYYNTVVTLDFTIDGLPEKPAGEVTDPVSIEGFWEIPLNGHYQGSYSLNEFTGKYRVTRNGKVVTFSDTVDRYDIVGEIQDDETTIVFKTATIVEAINSLTQVPYVNETATDEIAELSLQPYGIVATFNAADGTITFPENSGIAYGYYNDKGELQFWDDAYDFAGLGVKTGEFQPELSIANVTYTLEADAATVSVEIEATGFNPDEVAAWKANITEFFSDAAAETDWSENTATEATVADGVATFTITGLTNGNHDFRFTISALDEDGLAFVTSNEKALSFVAGPSIAIRVPAVEVDGDKATVTFNVQTSAIDESAKYEAVFTDVFADTDNAPANPFTATVDATIAEGVATAVLSGLEVGEYNLKVALVARTEAGEEIATSNNIALPTFTVEEVVIPEPTATYAVLEGETHAAGETVDVKDGETLLATLTFGFEGGDPFNAGVLDLKLVDDGFIAYTSGNGQNGTTTSGTTYIIKPKFDGTIQVGVVVNADKKFYVTENGTALEQYNGITVAEKYYGTYEFDVKAGSEYMVYCAGSKLGFYGFNFDYDPNSGIEDPDQPDDPDSALTEIEAADANARYFNLQGVEVVNPAAGVYIKVVDGNATKVVIKK
ncbi:MAG: hypothetical protein J1E29_06220 [Duncaniella sp.]|nr:hypothetical protein [Duncaniella sp.]